MAPGGEAARAENRVARQHPEGQPAAGPSDNPHLLKSGRGRYEREKVKLLEVISFGLKMSYGGPEGTCHVTAGVMPMLGRY